MDALNKNIPVNQPIYCDTVGEDPVDPLTVMYNWMHVRSSGPNCLKDNIFCGDNSFKENVTIEGNLTVNGTYPSGGGSLPDCIAYVVGQAGNPDNIVTFNTLSTAVAFGKTYIIICATTSGATLLDTDYYIKALPATDANIAITSPIINNFNRTSVLEDLVFVIADGVQNITPGNTIDFMILNRCVFSGGLINSTHINRNMKFFQCFFAVGGLVNLLAGSSERISVDHCIVGGGLDLTTNSGLAVRISNNAITTTCTIRGIILANSWINNNILSSTNFEILTNGLINTHIIDNSTTSETGAFDTRFVGQVMDKSYICRNKFAGRLVEIKYISLIRSNICENMYNLFGVIIPSCEVGNVGVTTQDCVFNNNQLHFTVFAGNFLNCTFSSNRRESIPLASVDWSFTNDIDYCTYTGNNLNGANLKFALGGTVDNSSFAGNIIGNLNKSGGGVGNLITGNKGLAAGWGAGEYGLAGPVNAV